jgi:zinc transport system ATP-binding protein
MIIACQDVSFAYEGNTAVRGLNFIVEQGDFLCIVGENGSGKSTLIKGLLGLMPPAQGKILTGDLKPHETGYLPQQAAAQKDFPASVFEVVLSGRLALRGFRPFYSPEDKRVAMENISRLGIADLHGSCFRELSGGQQRRTLIARSLCAAVKLLVLDEPAAGLDPAAAAEVYRILEKLNREQDLTVIMVSHDMDGVKGYAGKVLYLRKEQIFFGSAESYFTGTVPGFGGAR